MNNQEIEVKMEIKDEAQIENIRGFLQENKEQSWQRIDMKAIYYDTEDNFYQKHKIAYRVRCENDCIVATYKSGKVNSDGLFERVEINKKVTKLTPDINVFAEDKDIWSLIKTTKDKKFLPIVITDFVRECIELTWLDSKLEVALDLGFVQGRENKAPICEVEIELKQGKIEDLLSLKDELIKKFGLQISAISKYIKGLFLLVQIYCRAFFIIFLKILKKKKDLQNLYRIVILSNENVTNFIYLRSFINRKEV